MAIGTVCDGDKFHNVGVLWDLLWKRSDCVLKQFWESEITFVMGSLGVYSFSLFNFMGFKLWEIMVGFLL